MHYNPLTLMNPVVYIPWHGKFEAGHIEPNRCLYDHELIFFSKGEGRVIVGGHLFKCTAGSVIIIPPNLTHCTIADTQIERWCIHFDWEPGKVIPEQPYEYLDHIGNFSAEKCNLTPEWVPYEFPLIHTVNDYEAFLELIQQLFFCRNETLESGIWQKGIFMQILSLCFASFSSTKSYMPPTLLKVKEYIDMNFWKVGLNLSNISEQCKVTPNHLCRIFRRELGMSPLNYLNSLRIKYARTMLMNSSMNVAQIAHMAGFNDPNYFSRLFKKQTGVAPSRYYLYLQSISSEESGIVRAKSCLN